MQRFAPLKRKELCHDLLIRHSSLPVSPPCLIDARRVYDSGKNISRLFASIGRDMDGQRRQLRNLHRARYRR